jgi:glycosyltransferase involved in cell wall biosynthesis
MRLQLRPNEMAIAQSETDRVGVILPAFNVAPHLPALLAELQERWPAYHLLVVDDGSSDRTADVATAAGVTVIQHTTNQGKGAALATGYDWALAEAHDWVYTMDADGQHLPREMGSFLSAARSQRWDVVVGSRMAAPQGMPWLRKTTNRFTSAVISSLAGQRIPDSQSGYRLYRTACLAGLHLQARRYDAESEILVKLARRGFRIGSVPIATVYGEEKSSIRPLRDTGRFFRLVMRLVRDRH